MLPTPSLLAIFYLAGVYYIVLEGVGKPTMNKLKIVKTKGQLGG
jgi:hypothetical protein